MTQLDRRREQSATAEAAAEKARTAVDELDRRLQTNAEMTRQQTQALRNAEAEAKRLKRSLKTQARDHARLLKAHRKATDKAATTQSRAAALDEKYSKSVLADLVRREKVKDRAAAGASSHTENGALSPAENGAPGGMLADQSSQPAPADTTDEHGEIAPAPAVTRPASPRRGTTAATAAQATAARTTAAKAANSASAGTPAPSRTTAARKKPDLAAETAARKTAGRAR